MHEAKKRGWPLTIQDILMERVQFEDRVLHAHVEEPTVPEEVLRYEVPLKINRRAALHAFMHGILHP